MPRIIEGRPRGPISKLEAAERQLAEAIWMFFNRRDPLAVHTLVAAAHQVLADLGKAQLGYPGMIRNPQNIREGYWRTWAAAVFSAENFLKHADRDANATLTLDREMTEIFLVDAIQIHALLTGSMLPEAKVYWVWFTLKNPEAVVESEYKRVLSEQASAAQIDHSDFAAFRRMIELLS